MLKIEFRHIAVAAIALAALAFVAYSEMEMNKNEKAMNELLDDHNDFINRAKNLGKN